MKIRFPVHFTMKNEYLVMKATNQKDCELAKKLLQTKKNREEYAGKEYFVVAELDLPTRQRTHKQNKSVWVLVEAIFESMEGRKPTEEEKYSLYLDLLEVYAEKVPCRFKNTLRSIHISEANSIEGAKFIDGLLYHLATMCELKMDTQSTVIDIMCQWEEWRGTLEKDPVDYADLECTRLLTEEEWREKHLVSEASGRGGMIRLHHIITRGSRPDLVDKAWNFLALLDEEHNLIHSRGDDYFLSIYPHLKGKFDRVKRLAAKEITDNRPSSTALAMEALYHD